MIVKDEEKNIEACLRSCAGLFDEMIVIDTGSHDGTRTVAERLGARVYDFAWVESFAEARNESVRRASGDWVFWLDADEVLDQPNAQRLRVLFGSLTKEVAAYSIKCVCLANSAQEGNTVVDHIRLFPNRPDVRWEYRVHEQILPSVRRLGGAVRATDICIHHTGYQDNQWRDEKQERNLRLLLLDHRERPGEPYILFNLGWTHAALGRSREAIGFLRDSLKRSHPGDSIVRQVYAILASCHEHLGETSEALRACQEGRHYYPDDAQLLMHEANLLRAQNDLAGAVACLRRLIEAKEAPHFASVPDGLRSQAYRLLETIRKQQEQCCSSQ
jgi:glycosyltransferase involved in cell wall biosynthesis